MTLTQNLTKSNYELNVSIKFLKLIKYLFGRHLSPFFVIFGRRGTGKTDISLLISEALRFLGLVDGVATNIRIYNSPFTIERIINLDDLTSWAKFSPHRKLYILDEAGKSLPRRSPMSKLNVEIIKKLQIIRKFKLNLIFVTPNPKYLDGATMGSDVLDGWFIKPNKFGVSKKIKYVDSLEGFSLTVSEIPRTSIKFDTWDSAEFTLHRTITRAMFQDKELQILYDRAEGKKLSELDIHPQQYKRILQKYLRESLNYFITHHKNFSEVGVLKKLSQLE